MCAVENWTEVTNSKLLKLKMDSLENLSKRSEKFSILPFISYGQNEEDTAGLDNLSIYPFKGYKSMPVLYADNPSTFLKIFSDKTDYLKRIYGSGYGEASDTTSDADSEIDRAEVEARVRAAVEAKLRSGEIRPDGTSDLDLDIDVDVNTPENKKARDIWDSIDPKEKKLVEGKDLMAVDKNGIPLYRVAMGDDKKYHIYKKDSYSDSSYTCVKKVSFGSNHFSAYDNISEYDYDSGQFKRKTSAKKMGFYDVKVTAEAGVEKTPDDERVGVTVDIDINKFGFYFQDDAMTYSPLVIDFNGDGKVDAEAGIGIDIDGDGIADGAASNGDKMLAMSDTNGNGTIDGTEVFGNKTVNPFTGKAINAANGFEALKQVALSAEQATGIKCFDGKNVDLQKLKLCLKMIGVKLGFVSDNNNTQIENLSKISKINVVDYIETPETGKVQHNQKGKGQDENGNDVKVDDIWF